MPGYAAAAEAARRVLGRHALCDHCLGRMFARGLGLRSHARLGRRLNPAGPPGECYVCRGLLGSLGHLVRAMEGAADGFEFETFGVGAMLRPSVLDRDDQVRSRHRLRGADGVKTGVTRELARSYSRRSGRRLEVADPDVTFTVDTRDGSCQLRSRPVLLSGRYTKEVRGLPQRRDPCPDRPEGGCARPGAPGDSVEGLVSAMLFRRMGGASARFTWVGGEDSSSLVLGAGRPFFVRLDCPQKRRAGSPRARLGPVTVSGLRTVRALPPQPVRFSSRIDATVSAGSAPDPARLRELKRLGSVSVDGGRGRRTRAVSCASYRRLAGGRLRLVLEAEGGLPVRRFVSGEGVSPSVSSVLGVPCRAERLDYARVRLMTTIN